ncbi:hypothetical protein SAMN04324257_02279 [Thermoanaerobacter thermohydrosulfuricus]|nr:hypothetical protein SAMN04324257_02279 [Thermoanaerobacter thermohydrosulfuricus]HHW56788.1 hypothetical protein [Clostridia bacterium]
MRKIRHRTFKRFLNGKEDKEFTKFIRTIFKVTAEKNEVEEVVEFALKIAKALEEYLGKDVVFQKGMYVAALSLLLLFEYDDYKTFVRQLEHKL